MASRLSVIHGKKSYFSIRAYGYAPYESHQAPHSHLQPLRVGVVSTIDKAAEELRKQEMQKPILEQAASEETYLFLNALKMSTPPCTARYVMTASLSFPS